MRDIVSRQDEAEGLVRKLFCVVEQTADAVMISDVNGKLEYVNSAFEKMTGYSRQEVLGQSAKILKSGKHPQIFYKEMWETILDGRPFQATMINRKKNGELFYTQKTITPISVNAAPITHFVSTDKDITDRKKAEEQAREIQQRYITELESQQRKLENTSNELARSNRDLEQFASMASHDLQEPLRTITAYLQLIEKNRWVEGEAREYLEFAVDASKRLRALITDLLFYSRAGTHQAGFRPVDCAGVVAEALGNLKSALEAQGGRVEVGELPTVVADPQGLSQIFQNLLSNAIKYHGEAPPVVQVAAYQAKGEWVFTVADNGIGIPRGQSNRIFEMFQRLHARTEYPGTGIGLAICKKLVEQRGGKIWVESIPGQGSTFFFTVPDTLPR